MVYSDAQPGHTIFQQDSHCQSKPCDERGDGAAVLHGKKQKENHREVSRHSCFVQKKNMEAGKASC